MEGGKLSVTGQSESAGNVKLEWKPEEETTDAFGELFLNVEGPSPMSPPAHAQHCTLVWCSALPELSSASPALCMWHVVLTSVCCSQMRLLTGQVEFAGNVVKVKQQKKTLNNKEKKKAKKLKEARRARGEEVSDSEDEY